MLNVPIPLGFYKAFINRLLAMTDVTCCGFAETMTGNSTSVFFRHDIDTCECIGNLQRMIDLELELTINPGVYVRVDGEDYAAHAFRDLFQDLHARGIEIGLHTSCYTKDNYFGELERERTEFTKQLGFEPRSFSVHGLGDYRKSVRHEFYCAVANRLHDFGFEFSDCHPSLREYHYTLQDCYLDTASGKRFIYDDFTFLPRPKDVQKNYLVLTHPCYWTV